MKHLYHTVFLCLLGLTGYAQSVAYYSSGVYGTKNYEQLEFNKDKTCYYRYGSKDKEYQITYLGSRDGIFNISLPGNIIASVYVNKDYIQLRSINGNYNRIFSWQYQGPVNGIGTWCETCCQSGNEAYKFLRKHFIKNR